MSEKFTQIKQKRIDQVDVGDIIRGRVINEWSEVIAVEVDEEYPATSVKVYRPATTDGKIAPQRGRTCTWDILLPSWDLVDVQRTVDRFGVGVS